MKIGITKVYYGGGRRWLTLKAACNAEAKTKALKGDERKAFMKQCLSNKPQAEAAQGTVQQEKMKACNADAKTKDLKGDKRKAFMKECLAAKPAA